MGTTGSHSRPSLRSHRMLELSHPIAPNAVTPQALPAALQGTFSPGARQAPGASRSSVSTSDSGPRSRATYAAA